MDYELYAQLHGLAQTVRKSHAPASKESEFEVDIGPYTDLFLEEEKADFQEGLESFTVHANKIRQQVRDAMHEFYENYTNGYKAICEGLQERGEQKPEVSTENLQIFGDPKAFMQAIEEGRSIYELLGFSYETLINFYNVLNYLFEKEQYSKVRDGFFFLIMISPQTTEFWVGLGMAATKLQEYETAELALNQALGLDPSSQEVYIAFLHLYLITGKQTEADALCDQGIAFAKSKSDEPWAVELETMLVEAKSSVTDQF